MQITKLLSIATLLFACLSVLAASASDRRFIRNGMSEAEVILKIGKPDHEAFIQNVKGQPEEKTWSYFPHSQDAQTLTIITLRAGVVAAIERKIVR